ncbi:MAG: hypothetical protein RL161_1136, partial [Bacteroidota bacterium]
VISPCVTFNNNPGSTKSYDYVREHIEATSSLDFVPEEKEITINYESGAPASVTLHDGSTLSLLKLNPSWDPTNRMESLSRMQHAKNEGHILTGLLYVEPQTQDLHKTINTTSKPLNSLTEKDLVPGQSVLDKVNAGFR